MFDLRRLRYFVTVVDLGSMSKAADKLNVAQPAISQAMTSLEAYLSRKLLERKSTGVACTEAGEALYWHACQILKQVDRALDHLKQEMLVDGQVILGLPISTAGILSLPILRQTLERFPRVRLQINAIPSQLVTEMLRNGRIDLGVVFDDGILSDIVADPLLDEDMVFLTAARPPGQMGVGEIDLADVARVPLMIPGAPNSIHHRLIASFRLIGETPHVIAEIDALTSIVEAVRVGLGSAVLPWAAMRHDPGPGVDVFRIRNPSITRRMFLCNSGLAQISRAAESVRLILKAETCGLVASGAWQAVRLPEDVAPEA